MARARQTLKAALLWSAALIVPPPPLTPLTTTAFCSI